MSLWLQSATWLVGATFHIKIAPTEKADLVKFLTEGFSMSPDYPDHKAPELPK